MSCKAPRVQDYFEHVIGAIDRIETYVEGLDQPAFESSTLVQDAVIRNFEIIGEAASRITAADPVFSRQYPALRLDLAYRMRNALIHGYDCGQSRRVWNTIQNDLPTLKRRDDLVKGRLRVKSLGGEPCPVPPLKVQVDYVTAPAVRAR